MGLRFSEVNLGFSFVRLQDQMVEALQEDGLNNGAMPEYKIKEVMELNMKSLMQEGIIDGSRQNDTYHNSDLVGWILRHECIFWYPSNQ